MSFEELFAGNKQRYLTFDPKSLVKRDDGKMMPKYCTVTRPQEMSSEAWDAQIANAIKAHLSGKQSFGLSPLRDGKTRWAALDIDIYPFLESEEEYDTFAKEWQHPMLLARTKSGGVHVISFFEDWIDAEKARAYCQSLRNRVLNTEQRKKADEVFPKQNEGNGSQMNLPQFGSERPVLLWSNGRGSIQHCNTRTKNGDWTVPVWEDILRDCRVPVAKVLETLLDAASPKPAPRGRPKSERKWAGGFKRPTHEKAMEGRDCYLYYCGAAARARGASDEDIERLIPELNDEFDDPKHPLAEHKCKRYAPIEKGVVDKVIKQVKKLPVSEVADLPFDMVEAFNKEWSLMRVAGKTEFLNHFEHEFYALNSFQVATKNRRFRGKDASQLWMQDTDRSEYIGLVLEDPRTYDGLGWNIYRGHAVEPKIGDASLWVDYVENILCGGDKDLAHWVMSFVADGVQRPWSVHPGTALALRGGQGGGKSFLGKMLRKIMGAAHARVYMESERLFGRFQRQLYGTTFVLAEESIFVGDKRLTDKLKGFVEDEQWTYEEKFLASFVGKNVHRVIVTTNDEQVIDLDHDDRRWTVIEVPTMFDNPDGMEANEFWEKYYNLDPAVVLGYLLQYEADTKRLKRPYATEAKYSDKMSSDPLLQLLHEIAENGFIPDDTQARGCIASAALQRECRVRGESHYTKPLTLINNAKKLLGWKDRNLSVRNALHIVKTAVIRDGNGVAEVEAEYAQGGFARGISLGTLSEFRLAVSKVTHKEYPEGEDWGQCKLSSIFVGGVASPEDVETAYEDQYKRRYGETPPF